MMRFYRWQNDSYEFIRFCNYSITEGGMAFYCIIYTVDWLQCISTKKLTNLSSLKKPPDQFRLNSFSSHFYWAKNFAWKETTKTSCFPFECHENCSSTIRNKFNAQFVSLFKQCNWRTTFSQRMTIPISK